MNRAIPGYYYDEEKRKYFKIEKSHTAPASASWSADNVKRRKIEKQTIKSRERRAHLTKKHIKRSMIFRVPRIGGLLNRELGIPEPSILGKGLAMDVTADTWAASLSKTLTVGPLSSCPLDCFWVNPSPRCHRKKIAYYSGGFGGDFLKGIYFVPEHDGSPGTQGFDCWNACLSQFSPNFVHAMSYNASRNLLLMASNHPRPELILRTPREFDPYQAMLTQLGPETHDIRVPFDTNRGLSVNQLFGVATPSRANSKYVGAASSNTHFIILHGDCTPHKRFKGHRSPSDTLSLAFHDTDEEVFITGIRSGRIHRVDMRTDLTADQQIAHHASSVAHLSFISEHEFIAAGPRHTMAVYDIRNAGASQPVLNFRDYSNQARLNFGFAVNRNLGVIAASCDPGVRIFSSRTGRLLDYRGLPSHHSTTLQFDGDNALWLGDERGSLCKYSIPPPREDQKLPEFRQ